MLVDDAGGLVAGGVTTLPEVLVGVPVVLATQSSSSCVSVRFAAARTQVRQVVLSLETAVQMHWVSEESQASTAWTPAWSDALEQVEVQEVADADGPVLAVVGVPPRVKDAEAEVDAHSCWNCA